ncbi:MAG: hypothetical protein N7Q72_03150, partial [Spiroplasma sp. Tabriz.8]|nr:hypothetical protein [Spiroplasma sp. Tabriz.8]
MKLMLLLLLLVMMTHCEQLANSWPVGWSPHQLAATKTKTKTKTKSSLHRQFFVSSNHSTGCDDVKLSFKGQIFWQF